MTARRLAAGTVAGAAGSLFLAACAGHVAGPLPRLEPPALTASMNDLVADLGLLGARTSFTAEARLRFEDLATHGSREVNLRLAGRKPAELRLQGSRPLLPTLFVLVASGGQVWLDVPPRKRTYLRPAGRLPRGSDRIAKTLLAFEPGDFLRALVPDPPAPEETWSLEEMPDAYVIAAHVCRDGDLRPTRRVVFDRQRLEVRELSLYGGDGRLTSVSRFGRRDPNRALAATIRVTRPFEGVALDLAVHTERTTDLGDEVFRFEPPPGRQVIDVSREPAELPEGLPGTEETRR